LSKGIHSLNLWVIQEKGKINLWVIHLFVYLCLNLNEIVPIYMEQIFKRKLYDRMLVWKEQRQGATALLVEGARRVGKSTLVETFARHEYDAYLLIDFNIASNKIKSLQCCRERLSAEDSITFLAKTRVNGTKMRHCKN
jgi:hypothetical protein